MKILKTLIYYYFSTLSLVTAEPHQGRRTLPPPYSLDIHDLSYYHNYRRSRALIGTCCFFWVSSRAVTDSSPIKAAAVTNLIIAIAPQTPHCWGVFSKHVCQFLAIAGVRATSASFSKTYSAIPAACNNRVRWGKLSGRLTYKFVPFSTSSTLLQMLPAHSSAASSINWHQLNLESLLTVSIY